LGSGPVRYHENVPGFYVENFGCRATQADGAALERQFEERGVSRASTPGQAAIVVLNTCTVTAAADQDARAAIRRIQRQNPEARIVVTGCYAQRAPAEIAALRGVTHVIGNSHKHRLAEITLQGNTALPLASTFVPLSELSLDGQRPTTDDRRPIFVSDIFAHTELLAAPVFNSANERTRPNLKIQDGCDNRCSFCVIPFVRGHSRSLETDRIIREVKALVDSGYREVVLSGINLGRWGRDLDVRSQTSDLSKPARSEVQVLTSEVRGLRSDTAYRAPEGGKPKSDAGSRKPTFASLIRTILAETAIEKLRISSIEPMDWSDDLISLVAASPRIAKHAHVPMQSGSDAVLRRMHRRYRPWHYRERIEKIHAAMPTAAIGADVMVGFPGETDAEFEATRCMIEDLPFTYLHVFTYSARPGTPAVAMANQVPLRIASERNRILRELATAKKLAFMRSFIGKEIEAITLKNAYGAGAPDPVRFSHCHSEPSGAAPSRGEDERGISVSPFSEALTDNYLKLHLRGRHTANCWLRARVEGVTSGALDGIIVQVDLPA
jgi:threonylcarbamoyladenosine tRNA methylthiotransferase MtaB